ncbi:hypothetical protein TNCV_3037031 [Trichonephila clavipes]|nr:hypothetical protein TNCV_3037031 [Trichonephila clavipes]
MAKSVRIAGRTHNKSPDTVTPVIMARLFLITDVILSRSHYVTREQEMYHASGNKAYIKEKNAENSGTPKVNNEVIEYFHRVFRWRKVEIQNTAHRFSEDRLPSAAVPVTPFTGSPKVNHWSGNPTDSIMKKSLQFLPFNAFGCSCVQNLLHQCSKKEKDEKDSRLTLNRLFKHSGWASLMPPIVSDCRTLQVHTWDSSTWSKLHWFI